MPLGKTADILMYAPFVSVYGVPEEIHKKLTKDAFFGKNGCYVSPDFDGKYRELLKMRGGQVAADDMTGDDWPVNISELLDALKRGKREEEEFYRWLEINGDGVFKILGDAGTGKSTFIHYLQWSKRDILWHILDLKKAIPEIKIYGSSIIIPREYFVSLHGKILSAIILEIRNFLFEKVKEENNHAQCRKRIQELLSRYNTLIADKFPLAIYAELYENLSKVPFQGDSHNKDLDYCKACANVITKYFQEKCFEQHRSRDTEASSLRCALTQLLIIFRCFRENYDKEVIVFDNIERFIGADEIYNKELTDFLGDMRNFCDNYQDEYQIIETNTNRFAKNYQFIVSLRNTTIRNHLPVENEDFTRHSIDLSSWFAVGDIIHTKLDWYQRHEIKVLDEITQKHLEYILGDDGLSTDQTLRGLKPKLDLIFNYNKRLITTFIIEELLADRTGNQAHYLESADYFYNSLEGNSPVATCSRFGYRSVIWRSVLDWLRKGDIFQKEVFGEHNTLEGRISDINYIWKILSVLHRFSVANGGKETESRGTEHYMPFLDLIQQVYNEHDDFSSRFYEEGYSGERKRMARLLYYLNYYDRSNNNWFHFIDNDYILSSATVL